ncbi:MAG: ThuA domain-containing protein [Verrucomicrobiaceae bacterium]|nr:ThuA domain-containing protein [Verrucomicrobiaceae bacterium]
MRLILLAAAFSLVSAHAELTSEQQQIPLEALPTDASAAKIVLLAGSPSNKPGQHEYFAGCALLREWLATVPGVAPVMVADGWPKNEAVLDGARAVVFFMDGGPKLPFLTPERKAKVQALADAGTGFIVLHQAVDCPADLATSFKEWFGAAFQPDIGCRGHWDVKFDSVSPHAVTSGMKPFELLKDGWLYNLHFAEKGVTPLLAAQMPDTSRKTDHAKANAGRAETVAWAFERPNGGRSFGFTGCDLHASWAVPEQRGMLVNALLWSAKLPVPASGAATDWPVDLAKNLDRKIFTPKAKKPTPAAKPASN